VHPEHFEKVMSYVEIGKGEGRLVAGGGRPRASRQLRRPTVFADVAPDARIFQEEIFGPVVAITPFDTDEEALALANNTRTASPPTSGRTTSSARTTSRSRRGRHGVAELEQRARPAHPVRRVKASGLGHEGGYRSIDFYTDQQAVHITLGGPQPHLRQGTAC
jgi:5-carboxymethyl-2-hydroxymuconic-semialdehyde dehydrogenase